MGTLDMTSALRQLWISGSGTNFRRSHFNCKANKSHSLCHSRKVFISTGCVTLLWLLPFRWPRYLVPIRWSQWQGSPSTLPSGSMKSSCQLLQHLSLQRSLILYRNHLSPTSFWAHLPNQKQEKKGINCEFIFSRFPRYFLVLSNHCFKLSHSSLDSWSAVFCC